MESSSVLFTASSTLSPSDTLWTRNFCSSLHLFHRHLVKFHSSSIDGPFFLLYVLDETPGYSTLGELFARNKLAAAFPLSMRLTGPLSFRKIRIALFFYLFSWIFCSYSFTIAWSCVCKKASICICVEYVHMYVSTSVSIHDCFYLSM